MYTLIISPRYHLQWIFALFDLITALQFGKVLLLAHTVLPALRAISSLFYHLIFFPSQMEKYVSCSSYFLYTYTSMQY